MKKGWVRKSTKDEYPTGDEPCQKRGGSESQQKMNIQQEVGYIMSKKGVVRRSTKDEYPTGGGPYQKKGRIRNVTDWDPTMQVSIIISG